MLSDLNTCGYCDIEKVPWVLCVCYYEVYLGYY